MLVILIGFVEKPRVHNRVMTAVEFHSVAVEIQQIFTSKIILMKMNKTKLLHKNHFQNDYRIRANK